MTENILTDAYCLLPYTCKHCTVFKQFDGLNFGGLAGKHQNVKSSPCQNFMLYGTSVCLYICVCVHAHLLGYITCVHTQSELFELTPSVLHSDLPVVTANGPPVNENSEDHVSNI